MKRPSPSASTWLLPVTLTLLTAAAPLAAQEPTSPRTTSANNGDVSAQVVSPEAQVVLDRMTRYLRGLKTFSIDTQASRDEVVARGYKLQDNEHAVLVVQRPNRLRADIEGDIRNRTIVCVARGYKLQDNELRHCLLPADMVGE